MSGAMEKLGTCWPLPRSLVFPTHSCTYAARSSIFRLSHPPCHSQNHTHVMETEVHESVDESLVEQVESLSSALEQAIVGRAQLDSLYFKEIADRWGVDAAELVSQAVHRHTESASSSHNTTREPATPSDSNPSIFTTSSEDSSGTGSLQITPPVADAPSEDIYKCPICLEFKPTWSGITPCDCGTRFCVDCLAQMLGVVTNEKGVVPVSCPIPSCPQMLSTDTCLGVLEGTPHHEPFSALVAEKLHHANLRYCANTQCGEPFDWSPPASGSVADSTRARCPLCEWVTCVECRVPWHAGQTCAEYRANEADISAVGRLAARMHWMSCPNCRELIEKLPGCNHVQCKCGCDFCFNCGTPYRPTNPFAGNGHPLPACYCGPYENSRRGSSDAPPPNVVRAIREANRVTHGDGARE